MLGSPGNGGEASDRLRVLLSLSPPDGTTKYVVQLTEGMPEGVELSYFSWRTALFHRFDVLHVHWPEFLVRAGSLPKTALKSIALTLLILRLRVQKKAVVRTVHNLEPHEQGGFVERLLTQALESKTDLFIRLNGMTPTPESAPSTTILHGHYVDWFSCLPKRESIPGRVLNFGLIRAYKGVEDLLSLYRNPVRNGTSLRIVGRPVDAALKVAIEEACLENDEVTAILQFAPDSDLVREIYESELVVLPYRSMHNSGAVILALSLGRPVLVPENEVNKLLQEEVGSGWVHFFRDSVSMQNILDALEHSREISPKSEPQLVGRSWSEVGQQHLVAYRAAVDRARCGAK